MAAAKTTRWYVEPLDAGTNENAMMDLAMSCSATDDMIHVGKKDSKGNPHDVVEVDYPFVALMERNASRFKHRFQVFTQKDGESAMRLWPFSGTTKKQRA